jgi:hypothetical protein
VIVLSLAGDLYRFDPGALTFQKIGHLSCPNVGSGGLGPATPNAMALDRSGVAWINYTSGKLFKASTKDATCAATNYVPNQSGIVKFGMTFAGTGGSDTLFVSGTKDGTTVTGQGLATIDIETMLLKVVGDFTDGLQGQPADVTGTGDGKLWGFFRTKPDATLAEIDKSTAKTLSKRALPGIVAGSAWSLAFWGGDFWFFTANTNPFAGGSPSDTSDITRLKTSTDGSLQVVKKNIGFVVVGSATSTCAPLAPG